MEKKTDRRTLYTIGIVKDAFLELIRKTPYDKINVTAICKEAIQRIAQHEREAVVPRLMKRGSISAEEAELIFRFMLHGTFAVNRSLGWKKKERWYRTQTILSRFVDGGIREI